MAPRWSKYDDTRLLQLFQTNAVNTSLTRRTIEEVRAEHFPDREFKSFAKTYRKKVRKWNSEQTLQGAQRGK